MYQILSQIKNPGYIKRIQWERRARVKFSRTIRTFMRNPDVYSAKNCWSAEESEIADRLLALLRSNKSYTDEELLAAMQASMNGASGENTRSVWRKLQRFPHIFEVANARGTLDNLDLRGCPTKIATDTTTISRVHLNRWAVDLRHFDDFAQRIKMSPSLFEFFAQSFRRCAPSSIHLSKHYKSKKNNTSSQVSERQAMHSYLIVSLSFQRLGTSRCTSCDEV